MDGFCITVCHQNVEFTQFYTITYFLRISKDRNYLVSMAVHTRSRRRYVSLPHEQSRNQQYKIYRAAVIG